MIYCYDADGCEAAEVCQRAQAPDDATDAEYDYFRVDGDRCNDFICTCSKMRFVGSSKHGNYGKCLICGDEGEI